MIVESIKIILLFGGMALLANWIGGKMGFFRLPKPYSVPVPLVQVVGVFAIYLGIMIVIAPRLIMYLLSLSYPAPPSVGMTNFLQLLILGALIFALSIFCHHQRYHITGKLWKDRTLPESQPILFDFTLGILVWFLSFPITAALGQFLDMLIYLALGIENYEQVAVRYLRSTLGTPSQVVIALLTILVAAPIIEEFLFRGCLQTYFKRHLGRKAAILLASLCFALFHFSPSQGVGNISLIPTLFVFACFLGYTYERQGSLFASIGLHMTFNLASALRIILGD
jgi:membrane protease YdiL (CAAX protease family)